MIWRNGRPRRIGGYTDMGPIRIPPLGPNIILTDRGDGTLWRLSYSLTPAGDDGLGYFSINNVLTREQLQYRIIFGPFDGPVMGTDPRIQLLVRDGYLGYELTELPQGASDKDQARIIGRLGLQPIGREVIIPTGWSQFGPIDELAWSPIDYRTGDYL